MSVPTKYYYYFINSFKEQIVFKFSFILTFAEPFLFYFIQHSVWKYIFFTGFTNNSPLNFQQTLVYTMIIQSLQFILPIYISDTFSKDVRTGNLTIYLLRPVQYPMVLVSKYCSYLFFRGLFLILPIFVGIIYFNISLHDFVTLLVTFPLSILCCIMFEFIFGALSFFIIKPQSIRSITITVLGLLGGKYLPTSFFPSYLLQFKMINPFYAIYGVPGDCLIGKINFIEAVFIQAIWSVLLFGVAFYSYRRGLFKYDAAN